MKKMKQCISVCLMIAMLLSLLPTDITYATELLPAELTEETTETDVTTEMTTEATMEEISTEEIPTEVSTETEPVIEELTEESTEEVLDELPVYEVDMLEDELLGATSHKACASCQANFTLSVSANNSSWYQNIVNIRSTAATHALNDGYSGACASFISYLLHDSGLNVTPTPSCATLYSQLNGGAAGYRMICSGVTPAAGPVHLSLQAGDIVFFGPNEHVIMVGQPTDSPEFYSSSLNGGASYLCYPGKVASDVANEGVGELEYYLENKTCVGDGHVNLSKSGPLTVFRRSTTPIAYTVKFTKASSNPACTDNNPLYSLAGAEYVIRDTNGAAADFIVGKNGDDYIFANTSSTKLITDANGYLTYTFTYDGTASNITGFYNNVAVNGNIYTITFSDGIKAVAGTYRISETKAPSGYDRDPDCQEDIAGKYHEVTINPSNPVAEITCKEPPRLDPLQFSMKKGDTVYGDAACGGGSLAGAIYEVAYYDNYYNKGNLPGTPTAKWYFATDSNNSWDFWSSPLYNGNGFVSDPVYTDIDGDRAIPMGTVTVKEVSAPKGYGLVNDTELQGKYVVDGSDYSDTNCILYQFKWSETDGRVLRYLDGGTTASSGNMNKIVTATYDVVMRGDLEFDKLDYKSGTKMQHIGFIIKSKTTGEQHIIVTDENGKATTKGIAHTDNTNGNDSYLDDLDNEAVKTNQLRPTGIWFYGTADQSKWNPSLVDDNTGALPYDDYTVKEIVSDGNAGTQLIDYGDYTFSITDNGEVNRQTLIDMDLPYFETDSADKTLGNNYTVASKDAEITDTIMYKKLRYDHTYTFKGIMVAREDFILDNGTSYKAGQPILDDNGNYIRANKSFTTASRGSSNYVANASGSVALSYKLDAETLSGAKGVWKVYLCDGADNDLVVVDDEGEINRKASNVISIHLVDNERYWCESVDLDNTREWITFPKVTLHTTALSE
ncbi:MAG: VaFE repeat-containing surface-anchored protein, partial [Lachnospiraceae bacterium]